MLRLFCLVALLVAALSSGLAEVKPPASSVVSRPLPTAAPQSAAQAPVSNAEKPAAPPSAQNTAPAPNLAPPPSTQAAPPPDRTVTLQYPNSDVADVLRLYETLTGNKLIMDNFVQGKVNIFLSKPVLKDEAVKIIEMNLLMNGYSLVPAGDGIVKVIGTGRSPRNAGVPIISDEADIPAGDHVVSFLFRLRFADPVELQQVLGQYLSPPQTYTSFLALPKSSAILITENSSVIRMLTRIIDQIDVPPAQVVSEFIKLERADATKVVEMLKDVFEKGSSTAVTPTTNPAQPGVRPPGRGNIPGVQPPPQVTIEGDLGGLAGLSEDSIVVGKIKIAADVRTNRIHVITRPVNMPFVRKLISEFDANVEFGKPVTRPLRYISAADILPVLVQALTEPGANQGQGADASNPAAPQQQAQQNRPRTTSNAGGFDSGFGSSGSGGQSFSEELSTQAVDTTPKAVTIGNAKIIADQRANTIIVLGNREVVVKVTKILDEMDVKAPQVALSTVIGELSLNSDQEFGVDYFQRKVGIPGPNHEGGVAGFSRSNPLDTPLSEPGSLVNFTQLAEAAATGGTNVFLSTGFGLKAIVRMLDSTGRFKVISRPMVFTSNNKKAIIASGTEVPVPVNSSINVGQTFSSVQFKKVALQLEVVPLINSEKEVSLDILQKLDNVATSTVIDGNSIPNIATRYIKTTVSAANGSCIVLGGLIQENKRKTKNGIPILGRIPVIGGIFRNTKETKDRTELIILMQPEVALTKLDLHRLRQKHEDKSHFGPELDQDCPDCPAPSEDKEIVLPGPDLPGMK